MKESNLTNRLREMAVSHPSRSETARLSDVFNDVEAALTAGVSRAKILEALQADGFTMNMKSFESALYRLRKRQSKSPAQKTAVSANQRNTPPTSSAPGQPRFKHNPTPPDDILD